MCHRTSLSCTFPTAAVTYIKKIFSKGIIIYNVIIFNFNCVISALTDPGLPVLWLFHPGAPLCACLQKCRQPAFQHADNGASPVPFNATRYFLPAQTHYLHTPTYSPQLAVFLLLQFFPGKSWREHIRWGGNHGISDSAAALPCNIN